MQDYIAMVLVWYATEQSQKTQNSLEIQTVVDKLVQMEAIIDKMAWFVWHFISVRHPTFPHLPGRKYLGVFLANWTWVN